jgi:hypothetical protein
VLCANPIDQQTQKWDPATGGWTTVAGAPRAGYGEKQAAPEDIFWTSVLLPLRPPGYRARVLLAGKRVARVLDLGERGRGTNAAWIDTAPRALGAAPGRHPASPERENCNAVLLPDGGVLILGGTVQHGEDDHAILAAELYDPCTDRWTTLGSATVPRGYHSVALLLPDGRVWTSGNSRNAEPGSPNRELRIEIFSPPYLFRGPRPVIEAAPEGLDLASTFVIRTPQAAAIQSVALLRCGSVTHSFDADQRCVGLAIQGRTPTQLMVASPPDNRVAPPGYYLLFILDQNGVPSVGQFVRVACNS